jgi:hypothetical protein
VERIVARVLEAWRISTLVRALVVGPALLVASAVLLVAADLWFPMRAVAREVLRWLPLVLGAGVVLYAGWRVAHPPALRRFVLLAEERIPELENRLITAFDVSVGDPESLVARAFVADAERRLAGVDVHGLLPLRLGAPLLVLVTSWAVALAFALAFPTAAREAWKRWINPRDAYEQRWREVRANTLPAVAETPMPAFEEMRWRVTPRRTPASPRRRGVATSRCRRWPGAGCGSVPPSSTAGTRCGRSASAAACCRCTATAASGGWSGRRRQGSAAWRSRRWRTARPSRAASSPSSWSPTARRTWS